MIKNARLHGWIHTIIGALGGILLLWHTVFYLWSIYATNKGIDKPFNPGDPSAEWLSLRISPTLILILLPFLFILVMGISLLRLRPWASKACVILYRVALTIFFLSLFLLIIGKLILMIFFS